MKRIRLIAVAAAVSLASMSGLAASLPAAAAATTAPAQASAPSAAALALSAGAPAAVALTRAGATNAVPRSHPVSCQGFFCIYTGLSYTGINCSGLVTETDTSCRNEDESFANDADDCGPGSEAACTVRLFYHPLNEDNGGAWACIDFNQEIPNLAGYTFNNGVGDPGYGDTVYRDAAGSRSRRIGAASPSARDSEPGPPGRRRPCARSTHPIWSRSCALAPLRARCEREAAVSGRSAGRTGL
jgi:hypothetical protein